MSNFQLGVIEGKFADIIWENAPVSSTELCKICEKEFGWKKSTTYTVLKRLCSKEIFKNEGGTVLPLISKEEFFTKQSNQFVEDSFGGSLPAFLTAFTSGRSLSKEDISALRKMIDEYKE